MIHLINFMMIIIAIILFSKLFKKPKNEAVGNGFKVSVWLVMFWLVFYIIYTVVT